jgi:hypothetical protein
MINTAYNNGLRAALARYKLSNMTAGAAGYNPTLSGQAATAAGPQPTTTAAPPVAPAAPAAAGSTSARPLG